MPLAAAFRRVQQPQSFTTLWLLAGKGLVTLPWQRVSVTDRPVNFIIGLFPSAYQIEHVRLRQSLEEAHSAWWKQWQTQRELDFAIENIRFEHDPRWRDRFFSIQSAHDANHWAWKATRIVFLDGLSI